MFNTKKLIPPVAMTGLALAGCGDSGGDGGNGDVDRAIEQFCMKVVQCYDETQDECEAYERDYADGVSDDCIPLWTTYLNCMTDLNCQDFRGDGYLGCFDEVIDEFGQEAFDDCYS